MLRRTGTVSQLGVTIGLLLSQVLGLSPILGTKEVRFDCVVVVVSCQCFAFRLLTFGVFGFIGRAGPSCSASPSFRPCCSCCCCPCAPKVPVTCSSAKAALRRHVSVSLLLASPPCTPYPPAHGSPSAKGGPRRVEACLVASDASRPSARSQSCSATAYAPLLLPMLLGLRLNTTSCPPVCPSVGLRRLRTVTFDSSATAALHHRSGRRHRGDAHGEPSSAGRGSGKPRR